MTGAGWGRFSRDGMGCTPHLMRGLLVYCDFEMRYKNWFFLVLMRSSSTCSEQIS
jgi:hypothetical protein